MIILNYAYLGMMLSLSVTFQSNIFGKERQRENDENDEYEIYSFNT